MSSLPKDSAFSEYPTQGPINPITYLEENPPPKNLEENTNKIKAFVSKHLKSGRKVALVTVS
jgi:hypothetical protein